MAAHSPRLWRFLGAARAGLLVALVGVLGCGGGEGTVSGKVLYRGNPVPGGMVTFRPADNSKNTVTAVLDPQGNYQAKLPAGEVRIAVDNRELKLPPGGKVPEGFSKLPGSYLEIPEKFYTVEKSELTYKVQLGPQTYNIELK